MSLRRTRPPKQIGFQSAKVIDCGTGRLILTRLAQPISEDLTVVLEFHELRRLEDSNEQYAATVTFTLMTDAEVKMLAEALELV